MYHQSHEHDVEEVFKAISWLVKGVGPPWKVSPLGRPPKISPEEYASLCVFKRWYDLSYRQVEDMSSLLIGKRVDHSSIGWAMQRISPQYLNELVYDMYLYMDSILRGGVYITDSTGCTCDRYETLNAAMKEIKVKQTVKLHIGVKYYPRYGVTTIVSGIVTHGTTHDSPQYPYVMQRIYGPGLSFSDKAYDSEDNRRLAYQHFLIPMIKERENCGNSLIRVKARKDFIENLYQIFRGMVEGVFGGMETAYGNKTRCRLHRTRQTDVRVTICRLYILRPLKKIYVQKFYIQELTLYTSPSI